MTVALQVIEPVGIQLAGDNLGQKRREPTLGQPVPGYSLVEEERELPGQIGAKRVTRKALMYLGRLGQDDLERPRFMAIAGD